MLRFILLECFQFGRERWDILLLLGRIWVSCCHFSRRHYKKVREERRQSVLFIVESAFFWLSGTRSVFVRNVKCLLHIFSWIFLFEKSQKMFSSLLLWAGILSFFSLNISEPKCLNCSSISTSGCDDNFFFLEPSGAFFKQRKFLQTNSDCFWVHWFEKYFFSPGNLLHMWPRMFQFQLQTCWFRRVWVHKSY